MAEFGEPGWRCALADPRLDLRLQTVDDALPALPRLADPAEAARLLEPVLRTAGYTDAEITSCDPAVVRYKPASRCTVVVGLTYADGAAPPVPPDRVVLKTHHGEKGEAAWDAMVALWQHQAPWSHAVRLAEPLAYLADERILVQGPVPGDLLLKDLARVAIADGDVGLHGRFRAELAATAKGIAAVHGSGVTYGRTDTIEDELDKVREVVDRLAASAPELAEAAQPLVGCLAGLARETDPDPVVPCHHDFRPAQVLLDGEGVSFVDFDGACMGEPALDLGRFRAKLRDIGISAFGPDAPRCRREASSGTWSCSTTSARRSWPTTRSTPLSRGSACCCGRPVTCSPRCCTPGPRCCCRGSRRVWPCSCTRSRPGGCWTEAEPSSGRQRSPASAGRSTLVSSTARVSASYGPLCRRSPMKNVGVPRAPLASALATSERTRSSTSRECRSSRNASTSRLEPAGVADEVLDVEPVLVREEQVVHLPETALAVRGDGRVGGELRLRVYVAQRQVPEHVAELVAEAVAQLARSTPVARAQNGTLEVAVLHQGEGCVHRAADVVHARGRPGGRGSAAGRRPSRAGTGRPPRTPASRPAVASTRASSTPTVASSRSRSSSKARPAISSETVKPMPERAAPPSTWPRATPAGSRPRPRRTPSAVAPAMPSGLPSDQRQADAPGEAGGQRVTQDTPRRSTPAFAKAKSGTTT